MTDVYLYKPPTWRSVAPMVKSGSLRYGVTTSTVVYRQGGTWHNILTAGIDNPIVNSCDVWVSPSDPAMTLRLFFTKPMVVPGDLYAELSAPAITPADPSWSPGVLIDLTSPPVLGGLVFVDNGDGTWTETSGLLVDNGDGTWTDTTGTLIDNGDGTWTAP